MLGLGIVGHLEAERIVGVEYRGLPRDLHDDALHLRELIQGADAAEAKVIRLDVEHRAHVAVPDPHAGPEQPAASHLQDGYINERVAQYHSGRQWSGHVT